MALILGDPPKPGESAERPAETAAPLPSSSLVLGEPPRPGMELAGRTVEPRLHPPSRGVSLVLGEPGGPASAPLHPDLAAEAGPQALVLAEPPVPRLPEPAPAPPPGGRLPLPPVDAPEAEAAAPAVRPVLRRDLPPPPPERPLEAVSAPAPVFRPAEPPSVEARPAPQVPPPPAVTPSPGPGPAPAKPRQGQDGKGQGGEGKPPVRIGDRLLEMGLISKDQLQVALQEKKRSPKMMGEIFVDLGFITEQALSAVLAESSGYERFEPKGAMIDPELLKVLPKEAATRYNVFPVSLQDRVLRLAMGDIYDVLALDQVKRYFPADIEIQPLVCPDTDIQAAIDQYYGHELSIDGILREIESIREGTLLDAAALDDREGGYRHPLVRLVDAVVLDAVKMKASDIHFEPEGNILRVRYRIDGDMMQIRTLHKQHWPAFSHRLKIMAGMNIADKLNPQDGRFQLTMGSRRVDFRVSSLPTVHGENMVLRILDRSSAQVDLSALGYSRHNFDLLVKLVKRPEGIIIVTGPTGSGKTTTLYSIMNYINSLDLNIMTLEDPVEFELPLIRQSQIREGSSMNFAEGIRSLMRQDPDVILVGEVRDSETASMALRAAMTGHQVYTTLHTNDAAGAIPRLVDLGMRPTLMSGNIIGVIAQRLARKLCSCKRSAPATPEECRILGVDPADPPVIAHPTGCEKCRHTGHSGRVAISEILPFTPEVDEMIIADASLSAIRREARKYGFIPMVEDGIAKVLDGIISVDALVKTVNITDRL